MWLNDIYQSLDPVAFQLGPLVIRWYGLAYVLGFVVAAVVVYKTAKHWRLRFSTDDLLTLMMCAIIGVVVGGRLGYVLFYGEGYYLTHPAEILAFNKGGMSFHGGMVGLLAGGAIAAHLIKLPFLTLADLGSLAAPLGLFFGRCANFVNGELWGAPTDLAWGVVFGGSAGTVARHPSQLYEAVLEGLVIFVVLLILSRKVPARPQGTFLGLFMVMYGVFRFLIEFVREPDAQLGYLWGGWLTMGQVLSAPLIVAGIALLVFAFKRRVPQGEFLRKKAEPE
jgi:phosphatidylglycerol:prolipoprotein diacylglycerol transferase